MTFAFDEQFAMFDITPVENQFILEYMPGAKGDYIKVYLYGLLCCYHPKKEMDISSMSRELGLSEDEISSAFRYWERRGIVRRISDNPLSWQYINVKQIIFFKDEEPDPDYVRFSQEIESSFDEIRDFHGSEIAACYEWKEDLGLSTEVIVMLLKYMVRSRGKSFKIKDAEKMAILLSEEKAYTVEDAEQILSRDEAVSAGLRKVLRKLGMRFNPSDANLKLYRKWTEEWHFTQEAIEAACDRMETSTPSLAILDSILEQTYRNSSGASKLDRAELEANEVKRKNLKELLREIGQYSAATPAQQKLFIRMSELFPQKIILLAARECAAKQKHFDSVMKLLESWQERGFTEEKQILEHIDAFHDKEEFLKTLRQKWAGRDTDIGQKAMQLLEKWENELGFSREMITLAADLAFEARKPAAYMDKTLTYWAEKKIKKPEDVEKDRKNHREQYPQPIQKNTGKTVTAQHYEQRNYDDEQKDALKRMVARINEKEDVNGGEDHA